MCKAKRRWISSQDPRKVAKEIASLRELIAERFIDQLHFLLVQEPDSEKSTFESLGDPPKSTDDSLASTFQPESQKSTTQNAADALSSNSNEHQVTTLLPLRNCIIPLFDWLYFLPQGFVVEQSSERYRPLEIPATLDSVTWLFIRAFVVVVDAEDTLPGAASINAHTYYKEHSSPTYYRGKTEKSRRDSSKRGSGPPLTNGNPCGRHDTTLIRALNRRSQRPNFRLSMWNNTRITVDLWEVERRSMERKGIRLEAFNGKEKVGSYASKNSGIL
ncbi:hypothetical protein GG344DRAFT_72891 [Lentinula edodes]|nr:hypothetical protein GG344DRAFT_72891 [Lentinula edodes]